MITALAERTDCGIPVDAQHFDDSSIQSVPPSGIEVVLARFDLPNGYCGILEFFNQFTDEQAANPARVRTPGIVWQILVNRQPLSPYIGFEHILNPWGFSSFPLAVRLPTNCRVELVARRRAQPDAGNITQIGGRLMGRYWYRGK